MAGAGRGAGEQRSGGAREHLCTSAPCSHAQISPCVTLAYGEVYVGKEPAPVGIVVEAVTPRGKVGGCYLVQQDVSSG